MNKVFNCMLFILAMFFTFGATSAEKTKSVDINKDGKPDVIYHHDGGNINKIQADTNYDGKHDVEVHIKDGKFQEAKIDTDHDGKVDKTITSTVQFKQWVNDNRPDFNDSLGWDDYSRKIDKVFWKPGKNN